MSNARRLKLKPREPDEVEAAFRAALREGCPYCGSRIVTSRFRAGVWDYGLRCDPSCRTFTEPQLAHRVAAEAAQRAAAATGQRLRYEAFDGSTGRIEGAVRVLAGGQRP
jgi:ribosomal protein L37AE/L43A